MISINVAPLNLAHYHERRAEKKLKHNLFDEAINEIEIALAHIDDAYKVVVISKAIEVLDTQKSEYIRKMRQFEIRKSQYERRKLREISSQEANENAKQHSSKFETTSEVSLSKSIYETIEDFDAKFSSILKVHTEQKSKEGKDLIAYSFECNKQNETGEDFPSLDPLELPAFDFNVFNVSVQVNTAQNK